MVRQGLLSALMVLGFCAAFSAPAQHSNLDAAAIRAQQQQIRSEATARSGRYRNLPEAQLERLLEQQETVARLTTGIGRTTELSEREQIELFNALETIEAIVNLDEDGRMVCERVRPVGSNRPKTVCMTVAERRSAREAAQQGIDRRDQKPEPDWRTGR